MHSCSIRLSSIQMHIIKSFCIFILFTCSLILIESFCYSFLFTYLCFYCYILPHKWILIPFIFSVFQTHYKIYPMFSLANEHYFLFSYSIVLFNIWILYFHPFFTSIYNLLFFQTAHLILFCICFCLLQMHINSYSIIPFKCILTPNWYSSFSFQLHIKYNTIMYYSNEMLIINFYYVVFYCN